MINIQEYQIKKKEEEIVNHALKGGSLVTTYDIATKLNQFFTGKVAGLPYYKNLRISPHSKSDKDVYNNSFKELGSDLDVAYTIYNNQEKEVLKAKESFDYEILELYKEFEELNCEIELSDKYSNKGVIYHPRTISFNTLKNVNSKNLYNHNIPHTTCEIEFDKSILRNEQYSTPNDKIDLSKAIINLSTKSKTISYNKDASLIVSESSTEILNVETRSLSDTPQCLIIDVSLDGLREMSKITLDCYNIKSSTVTLYLSDDGENFAKTQPKAGEKHLTWAFNKRAVRSIKIEIQKEYNDIVQENANVSYFSLVNISAYNDKYSPSGVFTSERLVFEEPITEIVILPDHSIYPKTDISYFIGYEDKNDDIEWHPIKPDEPVDLKLLSNEEMILNYITSDIFGQWDFDRETNKMLFYIHDLPKYVSMNSIQLRAGHSQWLIERLDVTEKYGQSYPTDKKVSLSDYSKKYVKAIAPLDMSMTDLRCEQEWNYFVMSSYIICDNDTIIEDRFITYDFTLDDEGNKQEVLDVALLINGRRVYDKDGKFSFRLNKGENSIKIMMLFGNQDIGTPSNPNELKNISHNFNLLGFSDAVFAGPKMERVSYNALYKHISEKELKYYAIKEVDGVQCIVTKFDPNYVLNPNAPYAERVIPPMYEPPKAHINCSEYMRTYLNYKHMSPSIREKITNKDGDSSIRCRLMARLTSSDVSISPSIRNIKVVGI